MKNTILLVIIVLGSINVYSQNIVVAAPDPSDTAFVFTRVEKGATFPGGLPGWKKYLERNLNTRLAAKHIKLKGTERVAQQTVIIQFIVDENGKVSNARAINTAQLGEIHPELVQEAIRVITQGPTWLPAEQNGKKVSYQAIQNITFQVAK